MQSVPLLDCAGRRRSPATLASFHEGHPPRNKGLSYPPEPPTVEEIIAVMRAAGDDPDGVRLRGVIVVLWRAGLRISEALALSETDLDPERGAILVRRGKGGKRREVGTVSDMHSPRVKVCGVARLDDAVLAAELGAWAVGMVFYRPSPRSCSVAEAERITAALRRRTELVGVFVNSSLDEVGRLSERLGLTLVQLHGDEGPSFCAEVARRTGARVIKAAPIAGPGALQDLERFHTDFHLLDGHVPGLRGGGGKTFEWELLAGRRSKVPAILSGGLNPDNVGAAIAAAHPYAVDVASGVERAPGVKDPDKLAAFFGAVAAAGTTASVAPAAAGPTVESSPEPVAPAGVG